MIKYRFFVGEETMSGYLQKINKEFKLLKDII